MTFSELLQSLNADAHLDINDALQSGGCTIRFDDNIDITFENHDSHVYLFSPVMQITQPLSDDFFASLFADPFIRYRYALLLVWLRRRGPANHPLLPNGFSPVIGRSRPDVRRNAN